jgi:hypothetical protein
MSTELDATTRDTVARIAALEARRNEIDTEISELKGKLAADLAEGAYTVGGKPALSITTGRRFDPALAAEVLPPELLALCTASTVDPKRAKATLPPALYERCQRPYGKPTVQVR